MTTWLLSWPSKWQAGVHLRLHVRSINGQELPSEQVELAAQDNEFAEYLPEGRPSEISNGAKVGLQVPQQPDHLNITMRLRLQPPARPHPVKIAVRHRYLWRRSSAAISPYPDAELVGLVGQVVLDACARKDGDADRRDVQHLIVALGPRRR
jgi:hypothetical protein